MRYSLYKLNKTNIINILLSPQSKYESVSKDVLMQIRNFKNMFLKLEFKLFKVSKQSNSLLWQRFRDLGRHC